MVRRRPASRLSPPGSRALDVSVHPRIPAAIVCAVVLAAIFLAHPKPSQARSLILISPPSRNQSQARRIERLHAQLRRQLQSLGIAVIEEPAFAATARGLGLAEKEALRKDSLSGICDALSVDGVLIVGLARRGRMNRLSAFLFDARGHLLVKRQRHQRRAQPPRGWLRALVRAVDQRLDPALPPLEELPEFLPENVPLVPLAVRAQAGGAQAQEPAVAFDWQPAIELGVESLGTSNLYADATRQMDLALHPWLDLGLDLTGNWALGYRGELSTWLREEALLQHAHRLYLAKGYAFGPQSQHSLVLLADASGKLNRRAYENLDFWQANLQARLDVQALAWLNLQAGGSLGGRWFPHDVQSNSLDTQLRAGLEVRLPAGWRLDLSGQADARLYTQSEAGAAQAHDLQFDGQLRLRGSLWRRAKGTAEVGYRLAIGDSHQVQRMLAEAQIRALGDTYLGSGPLASLRIVQLLGERSQISARLHYERCDYASWPALDAGGGDLGRLRRDQRFGPVIAYGYNGWTGQDRAAGLPFEYKLRLEYGYTRQWSNGPWTDVDIHMMSLNLQGVF